MMERASRALATWQRVAALLILLVLGIASLPLSAFVLDDEGTENWILPAAAALVLLAGGAVGWALPGLAGADASRRRGAGVGALVGVGMLVVGVVLFFLLLNGLSGA